MVDCTREWMRVLKPTGSMFVDLGDKYTTSMYSHSSVRNVPQADGEWSKTGQRGKPNIQPHRQEPAAPPKSLMLLPERYRIACVDRLGLICRAVIVWAKPNGLPESVTDRVRRSHEDWVHLTKRPRYYSAIDEIREPHSDGTHPGRTRSVGNDSGAGVRHRTFAGDTDTFNPLGKLPGSVWSIPTEPLQVPAHLGVDHFAAYPTEWPRRLILGWSPPGICTACGEGRRPVSVVGKAVQHGNGRHQPGAVQLAAGAAVTGQAMASKWSTTTTIVGYVCACTPHTEDAVICPACHCPVPSVYVGTSTTVVSGVPEPDHGRRRSEGVKDQGAEAEPVLLQGLLEPVLSTNSDINPGMDTDIEGLHRGENADPPDGGPIGVCAPTPVGDGRTPRQDSGAGRGCPPSQRQPGGQPARKSRGDGKARPRPRIRLNQTPPDRLPLLRSRGSGDGGCPRCGSPPTRPSVILDPFGGTGTTALVAAALGRIGVSVDMSADYSRLAAWRTTDPRELAKAMRVPKPEPVADAQLDLFDPKAL